jgi:hypothetical protein
MKFDNLIKQYLNENSSLQAGREEAKRLDEFRNQAAIALRNSGLKCINFPTELDDVLKNSTIKSAQRDNFNGVLNIIRDSGRDIVLIDLGTIKMPFYKSTGEGGKELVAKDKWYPFFGVAEGWTWINKGSQFQINNYYGSEILKNTAQKLDQILGSQDVGWPKGIWGPKNAEQIRRVINQNLSPVKRDDPHELFCKNVANVLAKVQGSSILKINGKAGSMQLRLPTAINPRIIKRIVGDDAKFFSDPQFTFVKPEKFSGVDWAIEPNLNATNKTYLNDTELAVRTTIQRGTVISLGNKRAGQITIEV